MFYVLSDFICDRNWNCVKTNACFNFCTLLRSQLYSCIFKISLSLYLYMDIYISEIEGTNNDVGTNIDNIPDNEFLLMTKSTRCYTCHVCNAQFVRSNHLTRHMTFHKAVLVHKCDRCDKAFATPEFLAKHTQEDHIDKPYTCTICDKTYSRGEHLIRHLKVHLNPTEIDIKCSICEKEFTR